MVSPTVTAPQSTPELSREQIEQIDALAEKAARRNRGGEVKSIEIQGIHLAHIGGRCEVSAQTMDGKWRTVISLPESDFLPGERGSPVSHIAEPSGIASAPERGI